MGGELMAWRSSNYSPLSRFFMLFCSHYHRSVELKTWQSAPAQCTRQCAALPATGASPMYAAMCTCPMYVAMCTCPVYAAMCTRPMYAQRAALPATGASPMYAAMCSSARGRRFPNVCGNVRSFGKCRKRYSFRRLGGVFQDVRKMCFLCAEKITFLEGENL